MSIFATIPRNQVVLSRKVRDSSHLNCPESGQYWAILGNCPGLARAIAQNMGNNDSRFRDSLKPDFEVWSAHLPSREQTRVRWSRWLQATIPTQTSRCLHQLRTVRVQTLGLRQLRSCQYYMSRSPGRWKLISEISVTKNALWIFRYFKPLQHRPNIFFHRVLVYTL